MQSLNDLFERFPRPGHIEWIGVRPVKKGALDAVLEVEASTGKGLVGDHYNGRSGNRDVTLIQAEHLPVIAALMGQEHLEPTLLRRNLVVSGLNLLALKKHQVRIGAGPDRQPVILEITGECHPCSRMETNLGPGGYNAVRGHGGLTARVVQGGTIRVGDEVVPITPAVG